jgi:hypothetical protein
MPNGDSKRLLEQLTAVVQEREPQSLRPVIEDDRTGARRLERHATAELGAMRHQAPDKMWEIAGLSSRVQGEQGLATVASKFLKPPVRALSVVVSDGCRLVGTPFDHDWHMGLGMPLSKVDGHAFVLGVDDGQSGVGVGIDLESNNELDIEFTPLGDYEFSAFTTENRRELRCRGGLGITAFENGNAVFSRTVQLFVFNSPQSPSGLTGVHGEGLIADAASPTVAGMFGPVTLAPVFLRLHPGRRLQVWVWAWILTEGAQGVWASLMFKMPAARICAGPPVTIH